MEPRDDRRNDQEFLAYYVGVLMREARARRGTAFCSTLVGWTRRANREAVRLRQHRRAPQQLTLFA